VHPTPADADSRQSRRSEQHRSCERRAARVRHVRERSPAQDRASRVLREHGVRWLGSACSRPVHPSSRVVQCGVPELGVETVGVSGRQELPLDLGDIGMLHVWPCTSPWGFRRFNASGGQTRTTNRTQSGPTCRPPGWFVPTQRVAYWAPGLIDAIAATAGLSLETAGFSLENVRLRVEPRGQLLALHESSARFMTAEYTEREWLERTMSSRRCTGPDDAGLVSEHDCLHAVADSEFGEQSADVGLGGCFADEHRCRDLSVAETVSE